MKEHNCNFLVIQAMKDEAKADKAQMDAMFAQKIAEAEAQKLAAVQQSKAENEAILARTEELARQAEVNRQALAQQAAAAQQRAEEEATAAQQLVVAADARSAQIASEAQQRIVANQAAFLE